MTQTNPPLPDKEAGPMHDGSAVRETVEARKLPNRRPDNTWAGRSDGGDCAICGAPVGREEMEYELEYVRDGPDNGVDTYHVHIRCFSAGVLTRPIGDRMMTDRGRARGSRGSE